MTENLVQRSATLVTTHSYRAEARVAPDNTARLQAAGGVSVTGRARTQGHHVLSFRVKGQESLWSPHGASGGQCGIWLGARLDSRGQ